MEVRNERISADTNEHSFKTGGEPAGVSTSDRLLSLSLLESIVTGKSRQIPVDFFIRVADALRLPEEEKDRLVRS